MSESANDVQHAISVQADQPQRSTLTPADKPVRAPKVGPQVRQAIELMVNEGMRWNDAAVKAGLTTRAMRLALERPHVIAVLRQTKQVLRESASAANIHRLTQIRDAADNMPAVNAIKVLEQLGDEQQSRGGSGASASPGVTIRIVNVVQSGAPASGNILEQKVASEEDQ